MKNLFSVSFLFLCLGYGGNAMALDPTEDFYDLKKLGKFVFFDNISDPAGEQSCSSCHVPTAGGTGGDSDENMHDVAIDGANIGNDPSARGGLKPPTNMYATIIRPFQFNPIPRGGARTNDKCAGPTGYCGGNFWNGRAIGFGGQVQYNEATGQQTSTHMVDDSILGAHPEYAVFLTPSTDQALNPFPNDVEQNVDVSAAEQSGHGLAGAEAVCNHVKHSSYAILYQDAWGEPINCSTEGSPRPVDVSFQRIALSLGAYQSSDELEPFSSKRDYALGAELACLNLTTPDFKKYKKYYDPKVCRDPDYINSPGKFPLAGFSDEENYGHDLFYGMVSTLNKDGKNAQCTECHVTNKEVGEHTGIFDLAGNEFIIPDGTDLFERYTEDSYHVIATPRNPEIANPECSPAAKAADTCREGLGGHIWETGGFFGPPAPIGVGSRKVPTLRNVDKRPYPGFVKAYGANGWFKSLKSIIHFYNTAWVPTVNCDPATDDNNCRGFGEVSQETLDGLTSTQQGITRCEARPEGWTEAQALAANCWPAPEFNGAPLGLFVGNLHLNDEDEDALVAYMKTFTDEVTAVPPTAQEVFVVTQRNRQLAH